MKSLELLWIHPCSCLTVQVENIHAIGHFKDQFPTALPQYARNLGNTVYESNKRVIRWAAYYYTHQQSSYPQITPLNDISRMSYLKPTRKLNNSEWEANYGKAVRQRTVRQETTMFKAGTLPLNMYTTSVPQNEKVRFQQGKTFGSFCCGEGP